MVISGMNDSVDLYLIATKIKSTCQKMLMYFGHVAPKGCSIFADLFNRQPAYDLTQAIDKTFRHSLFWMNLQQVWMMKKAHALL